MHVQKGSRMATTRIPGAQTKAENASADKLARNVEAGPKRSALEIEIVGDEIRLNGALSSRQATEYLTRQRRDDWGKHFTKALEIGVFCLERTSTSQDVE